MGKKNKKNEKILELSYTIEALEDEIDHWKETASDWKDVAHHLKSQVAELITENDRLTLTYEPYDPDRNPSVFGKLAAWRNTRPKYFASVSLDVWPPRDWLRAKVGKWNPGRYFQAVLGPIRVDVAED